MTKLNKTKIKWLVRQVVKECRKPSEVASVYNLSVRRVQQLVQSFKETGNMPELKPWRRPATPLTDMQKEHINRAFEDTHLSARLLYYELKERGNTIAKNKLYEYLKKSGKVIPDPKKQKQRKRCRYERKHTGSLVHGDTHRTSIKHPYCILWLDDASRRAIGGLETKTPMNNNKSILSFQQAINLAKEHNLIIKQVNTDRGPEFFSNKKDKKPGSKSKFEKFLISEGIKHIPSRRNNPQTNGKIERHWREYNKHRWRFKTLTEYINWYNNRLHGALDLNTAETPNRAFIRKLPPETLIGLMFK